MDATVGGDASTVNDASADAATPSDDAATPSDSSTPDAATADGGSAPIDGGPAPTDGGPAPTDGGPAPFDGGPVILDGGPAPIDGGPVIVDAGPGGCTLNRECARGDYCAKADGDCGGTGTCTAIPPPFCPAIIDPVCGCDGNDYSSPCHAHAAGVNVAYAGACASTSCRLTPMRGCCFDDSDCTGRGTRCVHATCTRGGEGTCVSATLSPGQCWVDSDCGVGGTCTGERICPCGAACLLPDAPGTCGTSI